MGRKTNRAQQNKCVNKTIKTNEIEVVFAKKYLLILN